MSAHRAACILIGCSLALPLWPSAAATTAEINTRAAVPRTVLAESEKDRAIHDLHSKLARVTTLSMRVDGVWDHSRIAAGSPAYGRFESTILIDQSNPTIPRSFTERREYDTQGDISLVVKVWSNGTTRTAESEYFSPIDGSSIYKARESQPIRMRTMADLFTARLHAADFQRLQDDVVDGEPAYVFGLSMDKTPKEEQTDHPYAVILWFSKETGFPIIGWEVSKNADERSTLTHHYFDIQINQPIDPALFQPDPADAPQ